MKILIINNSFWNFYNFRMNLISEIKKNIKSDIHLVAPPDYYFDKLNTNKNFTCYPLNFNPNSTNFISNITLLFRLYLLTRKIRPDVILSFTIKPNIYGGYISRILKIPIINNISGLGSVFIKKNLMTSFTHFLYKLSFSRNNYIFFQNPHDMNEFKVNGLLKNSRYDVIPGSGIDTKEWQCSSKENKGNNILFCARLILDKGINEFLNAARIIKGKYPKIQFNVVGQLGVKNKTSIERKILDVYIDDKIINYLGESSNMKKIIDNNDIVVLPSYREGMSRFLLESASMGKPIITTNVPGCKDIVKDSFNGFLCAPKNIEDLALKIDKMINLSEFERMQYGENGRKLMVENFEEKKVISRYLAAIQDI